jgi:hemolysin III
MVNQDVSLDATEGTRPLMRGWFHGAGTVALLIALPFLVARAHTWAQLGWTLCYFVGVIAMMGTSGAFHLINHPPKRRRLLRRLDHTTIFLAIAGSYFAIIGLTMHGTIRLVLLVVISVGSAVGIAVRQIAHDAPKWAKTIPYLIVGWAAITVIPQIARGGGVACVVWVLVGGLAYSVGAVFYGAKKPRLNPRVFGYHELFHALTLVGAGAHLVAIWLALR